MFAGYQTELRIEDEEVEEAPSQELSIPTQIFLWQQISPFIRPKLGKHHEATCTFCQQAPGHHDLKEAAKLFEKILVQNIQFGLSPNLANALKSIPRWCLVQSAFPYVMHSVSSLLHSRRDTNLTNIGLIETKLLYTLHWILADAADECAQDSEEDYQSSPFHYLFSIPAISLFIYLFAPLCHNLKESDFQHTRIENGLKIWQAMWEYQHPTTPCFTAHVKPKCYSLSKMLKSSQKFGDIFIGRKRSSDTGFQLLESPPSQVSASGLPEYTPGVSTAKVERGQQQSEEDNWVSSPKDLIFPETIPEESSSTEEEHMVVLQLSSTLTDSDKFLESIFKAEPSVFRFKSKTKSKSIAGPDPILTASDSKVSKADVSSQNLSHHADKKSSLPPESTRRSKSSVNEAEKMIDLCAATFLDVAVLRCLFISQWQEEGVYWALQYLYHRLRVVSEDVSSQQQSRRRSSSLPNPKIEVSFFQSPELKKKECKDLIEVPEVKDVSYLTESPYFTRKHSEDSSYLRRGSEKLRKKIKMMDLKTFVETKLLSKSEKTLEKIGQDDQQKELSDQEYHRSLDREDDRPCSAFAKIFEAKPDCLRECSNLVKGKSMPSLRYIGESFSESLRLSKTTPSYQVNAIQNPIITVTEHTPIPSPDYTHHEGSISSQLDVVSHSDVKVEDRKPSMTRSYTDSNISYSTQDTMEATGVSSYVTKEGDLDYLVILKAVHSVALRDNACCTLRVCEVVLNIVEILIDMGVLKENFKDDATSTNGTAQFLAELKKKKKYMSSQSKSSDMFDEREDEFSEATVTPFSLVLNCVLRVVKHLGCPHGCADGQRGPPADFLRSQAQILLSKLHRNNSKQFSKLLRDIMRRQGITEILDFFHAYVGFCVDPSSLLSPMNQKRSCNKSPDIGNHGGYATNFGAGLGRGGPGGIEGQIMMSVFKILVTRFAKNVKEFKAHENMALYCDIRQFMTYVKEAHGGVFRRVALSALLDSAERPNRNKSGTQTTRVIRRVNDPNMEEQQDTGGCFILEERGSKKMLFKKRSTSSTCGSLLETEFGDDMSKISQSPLNSQQRKHPVLTPRQSEKNICVTDTDLPTLSVKTRKSSRFQIGGIVNWFRKDYDHSDSIDSHDDSESPADSGVIRQPSFHQQKGSQKYTSGTQVGQTLQKAKKKVEDHFTKFGFGRNKRKDGGSDDATGGYLSRRNSLDLDHSRDSEFVILKERKMVPITPVFSGMQRFSFLLETCQPGSIPDPPLIAAVLDLPHVPVVSRAAFILECSYFVHCCNKGQWPSWMKLNFPIFRPSGPTGNRSASTGARRTCILQRTAGKLFYQWGEALGSRLEAMLQEDKQNVTNVISMMTDETRQKELFMEDEEEDFLDEASVTLYGTECPLALRLVACMLLLEITSFLRETYQSLPKYSRTSVREKHPPWERMYSKDVANRRWSMALSSMGQSQASAQSLQSIAGEREPTVSGVQAERKISFVLHEPDNESEGSSNTTVTMQGEDGQAVEEKKSRRPPPPGRPFLLRRGTAGATTGSFKRRSLKLTRPPKELSLIESSYPIQSSKRKVSSFSDRSDNSEQGGAGEVSGEESPGILSDDQPPESPSDTNDNNDFGKNLPWMKAMVQLASSFNFYCSHQTFCHPFCYRRHMRACSRLIKAVRRIYGEEFGVLKTDGDGPDLSGDKHFSEDVKKEKYRGGRKISDQVSIQASPIRREDSLGKKHRLDSNGNGSQSVRLLGSHRDSSRDLADHDSDNEHVSVHAIDGKKSKFLYQKPKDRPLILKYLKCHVRETFHPPLAIMVKGAVILTEDFFVDILPVAWELLLESNQEVVASAASIFILSAVKEPQQATEKMHSALHHQDPAVRIGAILRFQVLWKLRYQIWPRMEEGAHMAFKVPPPGIDFTLPSPKIGIESLPVVDPPWMPQVKTQLEDMTTISEESHRALVTATKTRKKQQTELIEMNLQAQEDKKRMERENFLITTIPIAMQAAYEPSFYHAIGDDHDDTNIGDDEPENTQRNASHHNIHSAQALFPSCLCSAVIQIVNMLEDAAVSPDGNAVYEVAYQVIWNCLVEDSTLFLRYVLERLTRDTQELMFKILRHLIRFVPKLPQQAAFTLYNYIIGYVMFYVRSPQEDGQKYIGTALSILWMVVHSVHGIMFKDLKQILRKEQCDASILLTANVPAAKKIVVHGPQEAATGGIPSQFPIQEDTKFTQILKESLNFFSIEEEHHKEYCLVDYKTRQIHNPSSYVRDFYFFKRSQYPQLELIYMKEKDLYNALQRQELLHKFTETGKVLLTWAILKNVDMVVQRVVFLHEELIKLPAFPRKALEADLDLCKGGELGKELLGLDVLHKFMWVRLIARMFEAMAGNFAYSGDIHLFLNVLNGALILHSEDACILRYVTATYINAAHHFKNIFALNGYLLIMPTLLQLYSNHQTNKLVKTTVEYAVKQFYLMNRKPFILQMFGSVSSILDTDEESQFGDAYKVQSSCLFNLLLSLEDPSPDPLNIGELVKEEKPLKAIDFCYHDESEMVTVLDCISLCVMVVAYSAGSVRGHQMLIILEAILPCYVQHIQLPFYNNIMGKTEKEILHQLAIAVRTLISNCEPLTKHYSGPQSSSPEHRGSSQRNYSRGQYSTAYDFDEDSRSKYNVSDHSRSKGNHENATLQDLENQQVQRNEFRRPRDILLSLVADFFVKSTARLSELNRKNPDGKTVELLDSKSYDRLAEVSISLLKVSTYNPDTMACRGLQRFMNELLPTAEWEETPRTPLNNVLRRLEKTFSKISKKPGLRRNTDWDAASGLLKGIYETLCHNPHIVNAPSLRALINVCQSLIVGDSNSGASEGVSSASVAAMNQVPPAHFCSTVVRLIALQIFIIGEAYSLEQVSGGNSVLSTPEKTEKILLNLIMPLFLRVGNSRKDIPRMRQADVSFALSIVTQTLCPPTSKNAGTNTAHHIKAVSDTRAGSFTYSQRDNKKPVKVSISLYQVSFLALKTLMVSLESDLVLEWPKIARVVREVGKRTEVGPIFWNFIDFVVTHRSPLYVLIYPFILQKLKQMPISDEERHLQFVVREKISGYNMPAAKCKVSMITELAHEMKVLKEELEDLRYDEQNDSKKTNTADTHIISEMTTHTRTHRPSLIMDFLTGEHGLLTRDRGDHGGNNAGSNPGAGGESIPLRQQVLQKGETSTTPLSPASPADESSGECSGQVDSKPPRLQRSKAQSRKTFRLRKSRKNRDGPHMKVEQEEESTLINGRHKEQQKYEEQEQKKQQQQQQQPKQLLQPHDDSEERQSVIELSIQSESSATLESQPLRVYHPMVRMPSTETSSGMKDSSWDEVSCTSNTSGYRESYSLLMTNSPPTPIPAVSIPRVPPPLASPDLHDLPSTSSVTTTNVVTTEGSSPDISMNSTGEEDTALIGRFDQTLSQHSLLMQYDIQDEDTLI